jgi:hypothetical protein
MLQPEPPVVGATFTLELHAPETHACPAVQAAKEVADVGKRGGEIVRRAPNDRVEFPNDRRVQVVAAGRQFADLVFVFLHRLGAHRHTPGRDGEAQEGKTLAELRRLGFLGTQGEPEGGQMLSHQVECLLDLNLGLAEDHEVVGVTHEAVAGVVELPVEAIESDVGEKGGYDPTLRRANRGRLESAVLHHPGLEKSLDKAENVAVGNLGGQGSHNDMVRQIVKEPLDVSVEHMDVPVLMEFQDFLHGHVAAAAWPEPVRVLVKQPLEERAQEEADHLLSYPVADGWDPQRACLALSLGNPDTPQGERFVRPVLQAAHQSEQVVFEVYFEGLDALSVDSRSPAVPPDVSEGEVHEVRGDPSRQRVVLDLGHIGSFPMEPRETETLKVFDAQARGGCFLASPWFRKRAERRSAEPRGLTVLMVLGMCTSANTESPFTPGRSYSGDAAIPEGASRRGRRSHRRLTEPFRNAYGPGLPGRCRDGVGLSPVSVVSRCVQAKPPITVSVRSAEPSFALREGDGEPSTARLQQAWGLGLPTRPKRDSSRTTLAWPLRHRPLPADAGCIASRQGDSSKSFRTGTAPHG